jgi:hypothetical protein
MNKQLRIAVIVVVAIVVVFAAAQLVRPERTNPVSDASHSIEAKAPPALTAVLGRACNDCHSNQTVWARYTNVAPMSWLIVSGVTQGRRAVNFSEWTTYPPEQQHALLVAACADTQSGKMPGTPYLMLRPEAKLSARDVETICAAAR